MDQRKYPLFDAVYSNLVFCLKSLIKFVLNKLPSNIDLEEEFGAPCRSRQQILMDINIFDLVLLLVENLFPNIEKESDKIKTFLTESLRNQSDIKKWVENHATSRENKT
jgi:hypothetical protein